MTMIQVQQGEEKAMIFGHKYSVRLVWVLPVVYIGPYTNGKKLTRSAQYKLVSFCVILITIALNIR